MGSAAQKKKKQRCGKVRVKTGIENNHRKEKHNKKEVGWVTCKLHTLDRRGEKQNGGKTQSRQSALWLLLLLFFLRYPILPA